MTDIAKLAIQAETKGVTQAQGQLDKLSTSAGKAEKSTKSMAIESGKAEKASNGFSGASRNLSFQLNQVAQQGAVTGNYLGALAIQLPDMLLSFGTLGILVGAAAGVMAGPLLTALQDNEKGTEDLSDEIKDLTDNYKNATVAQKAFFARENADKLEEEIKKRDEANKKIGEYTKWLETAKRNLDNLQPSIGKWGDATSSDQMLKRQAKLNANISELSALLNDQQVQFDNASIRIEKYNNLIADPTGGTEARAKAIRDINNELVEQLAQLTLNDSELLQRQLILNRATDAEIASALAMQGSIEKIEAETEALKKQEALRSSLSSQLASIEVQQADPAERARLQFERRNEVIQLSNDELNLSQERYDQLRTQNAEKLSADLIAIENRTQEQKSQILSAEQQKTLGYTGQFFGNLAEIAKQGGKEQFDNYKALASTQALISASLAVLGVLGDPSIPTIAKPVFATAMAGLAAVQIAAINKQEYQGARAMGGQVSSGNSYLVGENGPEIVHMNGNGNVQANHNLGGGENNVTVNVNIQSGVTKAELAGLLPSINQSVYNQVFAAINGGGSASQAVRRRA